MKGLHLLWWYHLRILEVTKEFFNLVSEETVGLDTPLFLLLLLDLQSCDLIFDAVLKIGDLTCNSLVEDHNVLHQVELHLIALSFKLLDALSGFRFLWTFHTCWHRHVWHRGVLTWRRLILLLTLILLNLLHLACESVRLALGYTSAHATTRWCYTWLLLGCEIDGCMRATVRTFFSLSHTLSLWRNQLIHLRCLTPCSTRFFILRLVLLLLQNFTLEGWNDFLTAGKRRRHEILGLIGRLIDLLFQCVHWMEHLFVIVSREAVLSVHSLGHRLKTTLHFCIELIGLDSVLAELLHHVLLPPFVQLRFKCV